MRNKNNELNIKKYMLEVFHQKAPSAPVASKLCVHASLITVSGKSSENTIRVVRNFNYDFLSK